MSTKKKAGRPPLDNPRSKVLQVRFTERDFAELEKYAQKAGLSVAAFVRGNVLASILKDQ